MSAVEDAAVSYYRFQSDAIDGSKRACGLAEGWTAPVAIFDAKHGFGEDAWVETPISVLATRLKGAPVTWCCGKYAGRSSGPGTGASAFQPRGAPNDSVAFGAVSFAQVYLRDGLIDQVADAIRPGAVASGSLRDDLVFVRDREFDRRIAAYVDTTIMGASTLELEADAILLVSYLLRAFHGFGEVKPSRGGLAPWQLKRACEAMQARLDADFGLDDLAAIAGCSPTHFSRAFKQSIGLAPFHWLNERRIEKAKELLEANRLSLAEIALAIGFSAQPQFTTAFGRATGVTPGAWRRERLS